ncbi:DNA translocase FtsK [Streptomyces goshikiensis]|uniref:DNA translocase FtsK n=1 Tax=Streptomyces goshikiensis TaxID=1942 RepID=UPI003679009A
MSMRHWDWSMPSGHPTYLGYATETAASMVMLAPITGLPWQAAALTLTGAAVGGIAHDIRRGTTTGTITVRALSWVTSATWASWALASAPLTATGWSSGLGLAAVGIALNAGATTSEASRRERKSLLKLRRESVGVLRDWEDRLARVARIEGCTGVDVQWWPEKVGYTVEINLPAGGTTIEDLNGYGPKFAADLRLGDGCGVETFAGANRGTILIEVTLKDIVTQDLPYPDDYSELTLTERFPFGLHRNGSHALGGLCNDCGILVGETDAGKTNTVKVVTAQLARMPDALIWAIDITGGGVALPWITPWATEDLASAPIVDWVAHTADEARLMLTMAGEIIAARKAGYQQLMRQRKSDNKLPIDDKIPGIVIVVDETASLPHDVKEMLDKVIEEGRAMRVRALICALRATQDAITAMMKIMAKWRVAMTVSDAEEVAYLFPGYVKIDPKDAPVAGAGWNVHTRLGPKRPTAFKAWYIVDAVIDKICAATAGRRPKLDQLSADVPSGAFYPQRWARTLPELYQGQTLTASAQQAVDNAGKTLAAADILVPLPAQAHAGTVAGGFEGFGGAAEVFASVEAFINPGTPPQDAHEKASDPAPAAVAVLPRPVRPVEARELGWQLLLNAGAAGYAPKELHTALSQALPEGTNTPEPRTVGGWLIRWAEDGKAVKDKSGQYPRYIALSTPSPVGDATTAAAQQLPEGLDADLVLHAVELVGATQFGSASMLQRKLRIGHAAAELLMDYLHQQRIVGPAAGGKARDVLIAANDLPAAIARISTELGVPEADLGAMGLATASAQTKE